MSNITRFFRQGALAAFGISAAFMAVYAGIRNFKPAKPDISSYSPIGTAADSPKTAVSDTSARVKTTAPDTANDVVPDSNLKLIYPIKSNPDNPYGKVKSNSMDLKTPPSVESAPTLDTSLKYYKISNKVGDEQIGNDTYVPFKEYNHEQNKEWVQQYFQRRTQAQSNTISKSIIPPKILKDNNLLDNILNNGIVDIRPTGTAEISFAGDINRIQNPNWSLREQRTTQFKFDQKLNLNVMGTIANRIKLGISYNTEANFDFQNQKKINYQGQDDEIIKSVELGDVSMPVSNSLIAGSQSLFGIKTQLQFGKLFVTGVFSQEKGEQKEITVENGAQRQVFNITADNYDVNKHFFLAHYFREHYNAYNRNYPALSNIVITRMEVWVTNTSGSVQNTRSAAAFMDLGEDTANVYNKRKITVTRTGFPPDNNINDLYSQLVSTAKYRDKNGSVIQLQNAGYVSGLDYVKTDNMRQLNPNEFTYNARLGYLDLTQPLADNASLAVAFEYTINGVKYQVGEFARDIPNDPIKPNVIFLKMLRGINLRTTIPIWKLMMKNIYSFGGYQVQATDFKLQVIYEDNKSGSFLNYLPVPGEPQIDGKPIIRILGLDRFNTQLEAKPDGIFDFLEGVTINSSQGRIIFPVVEPFGKDLLDSFHNKTIGESFVYDSLYSTTQTIAQQQTNKNKFSIRGSYRGSSSSDISLNAINVPQGSVKVYAGGQVLTENVDYTVDYTLGRVKIINPSIANSGSVIRVSLESNSLFSIQQKTLMGARAEYKFNKDLYLGSTIMYLRERPLTQKVNVGEEPIANMIWGLDGAWSTESRLLTQLVDKLPLIQTKEKSSIFMKGEFAQIVPGHPKLINDPGETGGVSYIDDFEGSEVPYDLKLSSNWFLASTPTHNRAFPEADSTNKLVYGFNRAKLAWYSIDPLFFRNNSLTPAYIKADKELQSNDYQREVLETEVFPNKQLPSGVPGTLATFDLAYFPHERGPYNYNIKGLDQNGYLTNPQSRWGGIMRSIQTTDFEAANIEYVEFWVMNPFAYNPKSKGGQLYLQLGNISEDILKDGQRSWENGLPTNSIPQNVDTTVWGRIPNGIQVTNAFDNDPTARQYQDVGYDGLGPSTGDPNTNDADEKAFFKGYVNALKSHVSADAFNRLSADPSGDNFHFYTGGDLDNERANIITRYKDYNNPQGNTPVSSGGTTGYGSANPDDEDINHDYTLSPSEESFYEYKVNLNPSAFTKDQNYVTDIEQVPVTLKNGKTETVTWYQFKVPIYNYTNKVGAISDFKSIRYMRMFMTGFQDSLTVLRFGKLQLIRSDWRKYLFPLNNAGPYVTTDPQSSLFTVSTVSIEQNSHRRPPYVLPPGVQRTIDQSTPDQIQQNESSLSLKVCSLADGDAKAVFKNSQLDARLYKKLKMDVHAEGATLHDNDMHVFIRVGTDLTSNYYEYDMPLKVTPLSSTNRDAIWPSENNMEIVLSDLYGAKEQRNVDRVSLLLPYIRTASNGKGTITLIGNPDLSNIKSILIGVRNPKDNGAPICGEVWVDELRLTDFDETGGWAADVTVKAKLADLGTVALAASRRTIGFGTIDQTVQQRSQNDTRTLDFATSLELSKFFPQKLNLKIPMYYTYSQTVKIPRYNPLAADLPFAQELNSYSGNTSRQDSVLNANEDFTSRTSLNFTNVQKLRGPTKKAQHIWDIENFYATYAYSEVYKHNIETVYDYDKNYRFILGYNFTFPVKTFQPFKKMTGKKTSTYTKLLTDFNLNLFPTSYSMSGEILRRYDVTLYRNTDDYKAVISPYYDKYLKMNRKYDFRWMFTKSLKYNFSAAATSRYTEPNGVVPLKTLFDSLRRGGIMQEYNHSHNLTYEVPINKLPYLDFMTLQTNYQGTYHWIAPIPAATQLGATISNSATSTANLQFNMITLYNKSPFLKTVLSGKSWSDKIREEKQKAYNEKRAKAGKDTTGSKPVQYNAGALHLVEGLTRAVFSLKNASVSYSNSDGTALPGFQYTPTFLGMDGRNMQAPGLYFTTGMQSTPTDLLARARAQHWITQDTNLSAFYLRNHVTSLTGQATLEPLKNFRITVDFTRKESLSHTSTFKWDGRAFEEINAVDAGSFTTSYFTLPTAFKNPALLFSRFEAYRSIISSRLSQGNPNARGLGRDSVGYPAGYSGTQQEVLMLSFLAAYSGRNPGTIKNNVFPTIPLPNWKINYTGLSNLAFVKRYIKSITITHSYRSTYTVGNYQSNLNYVSGYKPNHGEDIPPQLRIDNFSILEDFAPLIGMDITWINKWTTKVEYRMSRNLAFSMTNLTMTEVLNNEFILGAGYRTNKLVLPFKFGRKQRMLKNDFTFRLDISVRDNKTTIQIIDQPSSQAASGAQVISLKPSIDYTLSKSLLLKIFYTQAITNPHVSNQYPTSQITFGFSLRYTLTP